MLQEEPAIVERHLIDFSGSRVHFNVPDMYLRLLDKGIYITHEESENVDIQGDYSLYYPLWYLPQALGITIARLIGLNIFGVFYLGRFFNLLFYSMCVFLSIKRLKTLKLPLFLIGLLPMGLHQAASFSYDTFINGISILFITYIISCTYEKVDFRWRDYAMLFVLGILLAPAKIVYLPLIFLVLMIAWRWQGENKGRVWIVASSIVTVSVLAATLISGVRTLDIAAESMGYEGVETYSLSFAIQYPMQTILIFLRTIYQDIGFYISSTFGRHLSGETLVLPKTMIMIIIGLFIAGAFYGEKDEWQPIISDRIVYLCVSIVVVTLCMASMFFGWTSNFRDAIMGVQGRYFYPLLPLGILIIRYNRFLILQRLYLNAVIAAFIIMQGVVILYVLNYTVDSLYLLSPYLT